MAFAAVFDSLAEIAVRPCDGIVVLGSGGAILGSRGAKGGAVMRKVAWECGGEEEVGREEREGGEKVRDVHSEIFFD